MRVNIEESAWKRIYNLARLMGCPVREAAGVAAMLWSNSQDIVMTAGTSEEILEWADLDKVQAFDQQRWIASLEKARFISSDGQGVFRIHGNEEQLKAAAGRISKAAKGGQALKKKVDSIKRLGAGSKPASAKSRAGLKRPNAMQGNAKQSKAVVEQPTTADGLQPEGECGAIEPFSFSKVLPAVMNYVPKSVQNSWVDFWVDTRWLVENLERAVMHYMSAGPLNAADWPKVLTKWLFREKIQPKALTTNLEAIQAERAVQWEDLNYSEYQKHLENRGVKSFTDLIGAIKTS
ncbi:hypothetical protein [Bdellovibrio bacteriovorus]|uniref:hypothetical protein n=1 Tax=Bdellovibrio bacteriovorus TaxID=959 RepID=UPI003AA98385